MSFVTWLGYSACSSHREPVIREVLAAYTAGVDRHADLRLLRKQQSRLLEEMLVELLHSAEDQARERLSSLAISLDYIWKWQKQFRSRIPSRRREAVRRLGMTGREIGHDILIAALGDANDSVKLEAARALIRWGGPSDIEAVFRTATRQSPPLRAMMTRALRRYAPALAEEALPAVLGSAEPRQALVALEMFRSWGHAVNLSSLAPLPDRLSCRVKQLR
jgi:HEAT repeat protein